MKSKTADILNISVYHRKYMKNTVKSQHFNLPERFSLASSKNSGIPF